MSTPIILQFQYIHALLSSSQLKGVYSLCKKNKPMHHQYKISMFVRSNIPALDLHPSLHNNTLLLVTSDFHHAFPLAQAAIRLWRWCECLHHFASLSSTDDSQSLLRPFIALSCSADIPDVRFKNVASTSDTHFSEVPNSVLCLGVT